MCVCKTLLCAADPHRLLVTAPGSCVLGAGDRSLGKQARLLKLVWAFLGRSAELSKPSLAGLAEAQIPGMTHPRDGEAAGEKDVTQALSRAGAQLSAGSLSP